MPTTPKGTLVVLVRHGTTPTTGRVLPGRAPGLHLSETGIAEAQRAAERLVGVRVDALYTSPLERARETAAPAERALGLTASVDDGLIECDFGDWTGESLSTLARQKEWRTVQQAPSTFRFPGGESFTAMQARIVDAVARLRDAHSGGVIVCFSHADPIKAALAHALGTHLDLFQRIVVSPASISAVWFPSAGAPAVLTVNSLSGSLAELRPS